MPFGIDLGGVFGVLGGQQDAPPDSSITRNFGPWFPTQGPLKDILTNMMKGMEDYNPQYGPSAVPRFNSTQTNALNQMIRMGQSGVQGVSPFLRSMMGELNTSSTPGQSFYNKMGAGGYANPFSQGFADASKVAGGPGGQEAINTMRQFAGGDFVGSNPYLEQQINRLGRNNTRNFNETINPQLEGMMSMSGSGGGSMEGLLRGRAIGDNQRALTDTIGNMRLDAYNSDLDRMMGAAGALPGVMGGVAGNILGATGAQSNNYRTDLATRASGYDVLNDRAAQDFNQDYMAGNALPGIWNMMQAGPQLGLQAGNLMQAQRGRELADERNRFLYNQDAQFNRIDPYLERLMTIGSLGTPAGAAGMRVPPSLDNFMGSIGGIASAAGGIMGLFSDERLKTDITRVGSTPDGIPLYRFKYLGSPEEHIGVIAQEAMLFNPNAVDADEDGFLKVDYSRIS